MTLFSSYTHRMCVCVCVFSVLRSANVGRSTATDELVLPCAPYIYIYMYIIDG